MNRQQTVSQSQLYAVAPKHFAQLRISDDAFGDEFDWDESVSQYEGESLANDMLGYMKDFAAE